MRSTSHVTAGRNQLHSLAAIAAACLAVVASTSVARGESRLLPQDEAHRIGLKRAWFTQVQLDPARNFVERAILKNGRLTVMTTAGAVQEIDAQTGKTLWVAQVGKEGYPS